MSRQAIVDFINENIETKEGYSSAFVCEGNNGARISLHQDLGGDIILAIVDKERLEKSQIWLLEPAPKPLDLEETRETLEDCEHTECSDCPNEELCQQCINAIESICPEAGKIAKLVSPYYTKSQPD